MTELAPSPRDSDLMSALEEGRLLTQEALEDGFRGLLSSCGFQNDSDLRSLVSSLEQTFYEDSGQAEETQDQGSKKSLGRISQEPGGARLRLQKSRGEGFYKLSRLLRAGYLGPLSEKLVMDKHAADRFLQKSAAFQYPPALRDLALERGWAHWGTRNMFTRAAKLGDIPSSFYLFQLLKNRPCSEKEAFSHLRASVAADYPPALWAKVSIMLSALGASQPFSMFSSLPENDPSRVLGVLKSLAKGPSSDGKALQLLGRTYAGLTQGCPLAEKLSLLIRKVDFLQGARSLESACRCLEREKETLQARLLATEHMAMLNVEKKVAATGWKEQHNWPRRMFLRVECLGFSYSVAAFRGWKALLLQRSKLEETVENRKLRKTFRSWAALRALLSDKMDHLACRLAGLQKSVLSTSFAAYRSHISALRIIEADKKAKKKAAQLFSLHLSSVVYELLGGSLSTLRSWGFGLCLFQTQELQKAVQDLRSALAQKHRLEAGLREEGTAGGGDAPGEEKGQHKISRARRRHLLRLVKSSPAADYGTSSGEEWK